MSVLKIITTYQCTSQCDHCRFGCTRDRQPFIDHELALGCIRTLQEMNGLNLVVLLGGEPGLYPGPMLKLAAETAGLGIGTRLETNAFWATDLAKAEEFLRPVAALGTHVMYSLDGFHLPYVPARRVAVAIQAAVSLGMSWSVETSLEDPRQCSTPTDARTLEAIAEVEASVGFALGDRHYKGPVLCVGSAAQRIGPGLAKGRGVPTDRCTAVPWWSEGSLETLELLYLDCQGWVSKGCGIAIGNAQRQDIGEIVRNYDARKHPIMRILLERGPLGLAEEAIANGYTLRPDYADRCQLCQEARWALQSRYPEYLGLPPVGPAT